MVNDSHSPISQEEENKKQYTDSDVKRFDCTRKLQHTTGKPLNQILHVVDNNILQKIPILWEDAGMDE